MKRPVAVLGAFVALSVSSPRRLSAQSDLGLPTIHQSNLMASARSPLYFQPWVPARGRTRFTIALDYANIYELTYGYYGGEYVQDLELGTIRFSATRPLSSSTFLLADLPVSTAWKGGLDGFLGWWHDLLGIEMPSRELRPDNEWGYEVSDPAGDTVGYAPKVYLGDIQLGAGWRFAPQGQLMGTVTLPTATADGYGRDVATYGAMMTGWTDLAPKLRVEAGLGVGVAPKTGGTIAHYQRTLFGKLGGGFRWRFYRGASMYGTLWWHSPYYEHTGLPSLDRNDLNFDFGWIIRTTSGAEWRFGMSEDPQPSGPGVDAIFKASRSW
jgi:hypothetical protein